ncbi:class I SAM-dependent methyltransferase [Flavobacterium sp. JAS]|uniref:class I SAM-dependent methyltransferase n=1 Tax=Flavobacterium sp. JAS TaxID=2897329 RepID=UPI001E28BBF4|nr:SAM-dependent methyltransferase [Flavobacterium sp. JAS]MCD0468706.1 SAM-dependent methyltransferase [Flavobacterium sp. JAS]
MQLREIIVEKIRNKGPISFCDFMEMALYYPKLGYYTSQRDKIGTEGDYYTSSNLTPLFGAIIGRQLEEMWEITQKEAFTIVEYGAGTGKLCHDILDYLKNNPGFYDKLQYCIIEKSPQMRQKEKAYLHEKVNWYNSISDIPKFTGCILSNELIDNFAVHQVLMQEELKEIFVDYKDGFIELLKPATKELRDYLDELGVVLPKGFRTEINLQATEWIQEIASALKKGFIITIDYGNLSSGLYGKEKSCGTIVCYNKHTINENPYRDIGNQDITSHVNFSALCHWGLKNGLVCCGLTNHADFLLALGFKELLRKSVSFDQDSIRKEILLTHTLLMDMGQKFKVLIQKKGVANGQLSGLNFQSTK